MNTSAVGAVVMVVGVVAALWCGTKIIGLGGTFVHHIDTFCMNAGMMIWFVYSAVKNMRSHES